MNKLLANYLLIQLTLTSYPLRLIANINIQDETTGKYYQQQIPKNKHNQIKKIITEYFFNIPNELPLLSKEESKDTINKIENTLHHKNHIHIKRIIEQENLTNKDVKDLIKYIKETKKELAPKIKEIVQHVNKILKQKLEENLTKHLKKEELENLLETLKLDDEKLLRQIIKEHNEIINKLRNI